MAIIMLRKYRKNWIMMSMIEKPEMNPGKGEHDKEAGKKNK